MFHGPVAGRVSPLMLLQRASPGVCGHRLDRFLPCPIASEPLSGSPSGACASPVSSSFALLTYFDSVSGCSMHVTQEPNPPETNASLCSSLVSTSPCSQANTSLPAPAFAHRLCSMPSGAARNLSALIMPWQLLTTLFLNV